MPETIRWYRVNCNECGDGTTVWTRAEADARADDHRDWCDSHIVVMSGRIAA